MRQRRLRPFARSLQLLALLLALCACARPQPLRLELAHVNDTHSNLEPVDERLVLQVDGQPQAVRAKIGGVARLKTALDAARAQAPGLVLLHAGDAVQGTLYFNVFQGWPEFEFLNALGVDAMCLGNHEFDKGPEALGRMLALARFPVLAANVDASEEPALAGRWRPYAILRVPAKNGVEPVGVIGATTPTTPRITADVGRVRFSDPAPAIRRAVAELAAQGVNKIVLLSHNGYEDDLRLARSVAGLDVVIGGHSHTLLGERRALAALGLTPAGPYPTVVAGPDGGTTLVAQAWKWGEVLGRLSVDFDAQGRVTGHSAAPALVMAETFSRDGRPVDPASAQGAALAAAAKASGVAVFPAEDPAMLARLAPYTERIKAFQNAPVGATLAIDLVRGAASDPGPLVADSCLAAVPEADIALVNQGGLRRDLPAGPVTQGQIMGLLPFASTLVVLEVSGRQLRNALEEALAFQLAARPGEALRPPHPAGFTYAVDPARPKGQRITRLSRGAPGGETAPIGPDDELRLVTNSFLAGGGDGMDALRGVSARTDTGIVGSDAFAAHLARLGASGPVVPPAGPRVRVSP